MAALIDDGSRVIQESVQIHESYSHLKHSSVEQFDAFYKIEETVDLIVKYKFSRVALQFPDDLLPDAASVSFRLQHYFNLRTKPSAISTTNESVTQKTNVQVGDIEDVDAAHIHFSKEPTFDAKELSNNDNLRIYILGDTSYGSCCVDEVGAQHSDADFIVHYGNACLQKVKRAPVFHVFGQNYRLDIDQCYESLRDYASSVDTTVVVLFDLINSHAVSILKERSVEDKISNIVFGKLNPLRVVQNMPGEVQTESDPNEQELDEPVAHYEANGLKFDVPLEHKDTFKFYFIGEDSVQLTQIMMDFNAHQFARYSPSLNSFDDGSSAASRIGRTLKRRYYLVHAAKEAQVIGLIVATVSVQNYLKVLAYAKKLITETGKKFYVFFVGKLNVPKLANFAEVDLFCLISCAQNSLIDSKEFLKPIITPFELELALKGRDWTNEYISDFNNLLLRNKRESGNEVEEVKKNGEEDEEYEYSFISGTMIKVGKSTAVSTNITDEEGLGQLVHVDPSKQQLLLSELTPSMVHLQTRTYRGLDQQLGETPVAVMEVGRTGIAMSYDGEAELLQSSRDNNPSS